VTLVLRYAARSDRGLVRANNEDSVYAGARLLALADGMGGHAAGEVASQLVIAALAHLDDDEPGGDLLSKLEVAVHDGNSAIAAHVEADPDLEGMGTTLTAILFAGNKLGLVHIGDSRGYLLRDGELNQITKDDTFVQTLVDEGRITAEEAHSHPQRSLIMRALTGHEVEPTLIMREARAGDRYLLCSDGLSDPVSHDTILDSLQMPDVAESADRLIEMALRGGGPDNVTVVVADVVDYDYGQTQPILAGAVSGHDDHVAPPNTSAGRASAINPRRTEGQRAVAGPDEPTRSPRSRHRMLIAGVLLVLVVLAGLAIGRYIVRSNYYVSEYAGTVSIMRGVQGSFIGFALQEPYLLGCLNARNELSLISYGQSRDNLDCRLLGVADMRPSERAQVIAGLPTGTLDDAIAQIEELAHSSVLPPCVPPGPAAPAPTPAPTAAGAPAPPPAGAPIPPPAVAPIPPPAGAPIPPLAPASPPGLPTATSAAPTPAPAPPTTTPPTAPPPTTTPPASDDPNAPQSPRAPGDSLAPEAPVTVPPAPTVTALPPPPAQPGTNCRAAA
jgi:serine/threonine protein phosphatase PrpC